MVELTFKDVGQGDSIILEWEKDGVRKTGIIDCNVYKTTNPVLNHVIDKKVTEIEFMILSHPHMDHFSGFFDLLNYCVENKIKIRRFLHTAQTTPDYLKAATRSIEESNKLYNLFSLLNDMVNRGLVSVHSIDDNPDLIIPLGEEFKMEVLAPSSREINNYINGVKYPFDEESTGHPNANWLSTLFKIYNEETNVLLTSDVEAGVLSRIGKKNGGRLAKGKVILAQAPHHGSKGNLNKVFWQLRKRYEITPVVISVGKNKYKHPSEDVIQFFEKLPNYKVERTDFSTLKTSSIKSKDISSLLDIFSTEVFKKSNLSGDKNFKLTGTQISIN